MLEIITNKDETKEEKEKIFIEHLLCTRQQA